MMKPQFRLLPQCALVIPTTRGWHSQHLAAGSIVRLLTKDDEGFGDANPLGIDGELPVAWADCVGRETSGYLAKGTRLAPAPKHARVLHVSGEVSLTPLDAIRNKVSLLQMRDPDPHWTLESWGVTFGASHLPELHDVVRELGGRLSPRADVETVISSALRLILNKEVSVSDVKEARAEKTTAVKEKAGAKKNTTKPDAPARSMARTVGNALVPLLGKAGAPKNVQAIAKRLSNDSDVGRKDLEALRDGVNAAASAARDADKEALATQLSSANKLVRRLARQKK